MQITTAEICVRTLEDAREYMEKDFFDREKDSEVDTEVILERWRCIFKWVVYC